TKATVLLLALSGLYVEIMFVSLSAGTHSLRYFYTGVSGDIDFPEFTSVGMVDDEQFDYFDSNTMKAVPKTEWIRQNEGADYWDTQTQNCIGKTAHASV
uniref:MHC class I-like antigen recognition-like domain-containing protein n=1 Tax=Sinocyclocheilus rhinocerous TaxID=307959 RepID=A0A673NMU2_9TELE